MKNLKNYIILSLLLVSSLFQGCCFPEKVCKPTTKIKYVEIPCPKPTGRPKFVKYNIYFTNINKENYILIPKNDAIIMKNNWLLYKNWCEENINGK